MKKTRIDLENAVVHIADSKTTNGIGDMPMTAEAREALRRQIEETPGSEYLFPSPKSTGSKPYITTVRKGCWRRRVFRTSDFTNWGTRSLPG
jgi:integrase